MSVFDPREWRLAHGRALTLGPIGQIMAVINVTPDSFSDGGLHHATPLAVARGLRAAEEGAVILDIGGESTKPNAEPVSAAEEQDRVLPVIEGLVRVTPALISIDTYRPETARLALSMGAHIVNDVTGLQSDPTMALVVREFSAGLIIMHTGRNRQKLPDVIADQMMFLDTSVGIAEAAGVGRDQIVLDPGFGFAKETPDENFELMARFARLHALGLPLLAGTSRKRFLGAPTGREAKDRDVATAASSAILRTMGAHLFRVHDVAFNKDAIAIADAMLSAQWNAGARGSSS